MPVRIRELLSSDWPSVEQIYLNGIQTGQATFETNTPTWESWDAGHLPFARLAAVLPDDVLAGWAAISPVSRRAVYEGVAETSIYVSAHMRGQGVGGQLLARLIETSEQNGIWTLQAGIFPENEASVALHKKLGFRVVGIRQRIGKLKGVWRDTMLLERRSPVVGLK